MGNHQRPQPTDEIQENWISGHLHYHQGLDPVVRGFVRPLVAALAKNGRINAFFFVRYSLGGPHVRLRLRVVPGAREQALAAMQQAAERFLERSPSTRPLDEETIRRANEAILASDPHETDGAVYPDNSFRVVPFRPEVERYGGPGLVGFSLDLFTLSSVAVLEILAKPRDVQRPALLSQAFRLLLLQALGFAADETELGDLLRYGVDSMGGDMPRILEKGTESPDPRGRRFCRPSSTAFVDAQPPSATMRALEDSTVFAISKAALSNKLQADQGFAARFYRALAIYLSMTERERHRTLGGRRWRKRMRMRGISSTPTCWMGCIWRGSGLIGW
jgi:lantibiotic biosynthesis dehydratase-like protein